MNSESTSYSPGISVHVPVAVLAGAIAIFFAVQLRNTSKQTEIMRWQLGNLDKQTENLKTAQKQYAEALTNSEDTVKQAAQMEKQYVDLFNDLLNLAKDDKDAKEVVDKFGIKRTEAPKAAPDAEEEKKDK